MPRVQRRAPAAGVARRHHRRLNINELGILSIAKAAEFLGELELSERERMIAERVLKEVNERLQFLLDVGLDYLSLNRSSATLAGGEAQRIRLASQIGSGLVGVLYVLDEPSIGLHQRDNRRLIDTMVRLRDLGNTVIVVEHDEETIRIADVVVDIGPGAGEHGGEVIAAGTLDDVLKAPRSITGKYLSGKRSIEIPEMRRQPGEAWLTVRGAQRAQPPGYRRRVPARVLRRGHGRERQRQVDARERHPLSALMQRVYKSKTCRAGTRRSRAPSARQGHQHRPVADRAHAAVQPRHLHRRVRQDPHAVRLHAGGEGARLPPGRFSFNVKGGRCEACAGDGTIKIEMHFLPDVYVPCEVCKGARYNRDTLDITFKGKNIAEVLDLSIEEAHEFFTNQPTIARQLEWLIAVGLGYVRLGQPAPTLSGGEAQRVKLASELGKRATGRTLYILDEPTTGLHFEDVRRLLGVLQRLVESGNTVIVIEHNLDVVKSADWIIDLGPEGGDGGGRVIAEGTPEHVAKTEGSHTGAFLAPILGLD